MLKYVDAVLYIGYALDDSLNVRNVADMPRSAVLVGWQSGFEPMFVAVWSYLPGCKVDEEDAVEIAQDYLEEIGWFGSGLTATEPQFVLSH